MVETSANYQLTSDVRLRGGLACPRAIAAKAFAGNDIRWCPVGQTPACLKS
jgi:hypothetical protein